MLLLAQTLFEILEAQRLLEGEAHLTLLSVSRRDLLADLLAAEPRSQEPTDSHVAPPRKSQPQ